MQRKLVCVWCHRSGLLAGVIREEGGGGEEIYTLFMTIGDHLGPFYNTFGCVGISRQNTVLGAFGHPEGFTAWLCRRAYFHRDSPRIPVKGGFSVAHRDFCLQAFLWALDPPAPLVGHRESGNPVGVGSVGRSDPGCI